MADPIPAEGSGTGNGNGGAENAPQFLLQNVYLKDCSFEAPNGPRVEGAWNPQISLDLNTAVNTLATDVSEVILTTTVTAKQGEATVFLVEVKQAGVFTLKNLAADDVKRAVGAICPGLLFPYARSMVSQLVTQGGFPQFLLPPVNFDALYARALGGEQAPNPA